MLSKRNRVVCIKAILLAFAMLIQAAWPTFVGAQNAPTTSSSAPPPIPDPSKYVVVTPYGNVTFLEIQTHPRRDEILDDILNPAEIKAYQAWKKSILEDRNKRIQEKEANIQAIKKRTQEIEASSQEINKRIQEIDAQLLQTYYQYVNNIEHGASGEKSVLNKILSKDFTPDDLRRRVEALLRRTDLPLLH